MIRRPVSLAALGVLVLLAVPLLALAKLPAMPKPVESRCAAVHISRHVLDIGQTVTATAGPPTADCGGPSKTVRWGWPSDDPQLNQVEGLRKVHNCAANSRQCVFRAYFFTAADQWFGICIGGAAPQGPFTSCESYRVRQGDYHALGGTIFNLPSTKPIRVHLSGRGGRRSTLTNDAGEWGFPVKNGTYVITFRTRHRTFRHTARVHLRRGSRAGVTVNLVA